MVKAGTESACRDGLTRRSCRGRRAGQEHNRVPQERRRSCRLHGRNPGRRYRVTNSRPVAECPAATGETKRPNTPVVTPSEGNEVRRDGRQEVVAS